MDFLKEKKFTSTFLNFTFCDILFQKSSTSSSAATNASSNDGRNKDQPQTLDELLERQWEQGSQFLMEQASHFDSKLKIDLKYPATKFNDV